MDIWLGRCNKTSTCDHCKQPITVGEPCIFGKLWMRFGAEGPEPRRWVKKFHWHAKRSSDSICCWLEQALDSLSQRPYIETRGRKKIRISKDRRKERLSTLRKRARVLQRLRQEMEYEDRNVDRIIRLGSQLERLKEEIIPLGGVPKNWE